MLPLRLPINITSSSRLMVLNTAPENTGGYRNPSCGGATIRPASWWHHHTTGSRPPTTAPHCTCTNHLPRFQLTQAAHNCTPPTAGAPLGTTPPGWLAAAAPDSGSAWCREAPPTQPQPQPQPIPTCLPTLHLHPGCQDCSQVSWCGSTWAWLACLGGAVAAPRRGGGSRHPTQHTCPAQPTQLPNPITMDRPSACMLHGGVWVGGGGHCNRGWQDWVAGQGGSGTGAGGRGGRHGTCLTCPPPLRCHPSPPSAIVDMKCSAAMVGCS
jgi:hypothetical protein